MFHLNPSTKYTEIGYRVFASRGSRTAYQKAQCLRHVYFWRRYKTATFQIHKSRLFVTAVFRLSFRCIAVTMAKGIGNGFPMAAVVTTPEIAGSLQHALHFNTFGGNPLACAVGSSVLDVSRPGEYFSCYKPI